MKVMGGGRRSTTLLSLLLKKSLLFRLSFPFNTFLAHQLPAEVHFVGNLSRIPKLFFLSFFHERLFRGLAYRIFFFFFFFSYRIFFSFSYRIVEGYGSPYACPSFRRTELQTAWPAARARPGSSWPHQLHGHYPGGVQGPQNRLHYRLDESRGIYQS